MGCIFLLRSQSVNGSGEKTLNADVLQSLSNVRVCFIRKRLRVSGAGNQADGVYGHSHADGVYGDRPRCNLGFQDP